MLLFTTTWISCVLSSLLLLLTGTTNAFCQHSGATTTGGVSNKPTTTTFRQPYIITTTRQTSLFASNKDSNKGVYARPSAAIERGSGFFIPGLEGPRVRLLFGLILVTLTTINHFLGGGATADSGGGGLSELLAISYAILLLIQAAIEFGKEEKGYVVSLDRPQGDDVANTASLIQVWASSSTDDAKYTEAWKERVKWSATSYLSMTPATQIMLLEKQKVLYNLGGTSNSSDLSSHEEEATGCQAAFETLGKATSGRVSLPITHPTVKALAPEDGRCVVLQTINDNQCWMMTSNQLLQAFTSQDLKWLGQLATYIEQ